MLRYILHIWSCSRIPTVFRTIISNKYCFKMDIICFSHLRWNFVYQRPQHLLSRMAKQFRVFYIEEPFFDSNSAYLDSRQENENLHIIVPHLPGGLTEDQAGEQVDELLNELLSTHKLQSFIVWYY